MRVFLGKELQPITKLLEEPKALFIACVHEESLKVKEYEHQEWASLCAAKTLYALYDFAILTQEKRETMGACACTHTRDEEKNCDGTHKVVKAVKAEMAEKLEANGFPHAAEYVRNN